MTGRVALTLAVLLAAAVFLLTGVSADADELRDSVVKIHSSRRPPDFVRPWTKGTTRQSTGSGVVIEGNRILTNAHVVQYSSRLLVQAHQSTKRVPAKILAYAPGIDLALLKLEDESFFENRTAVPLAEGIPNLKDTVNAYGYPIGGDQLSITEGIVSRIEFAKFFDLTTGLRIQIDAALNPGNSGGPAMADDKMVGLVFSGIAAAENIGYLIPSEEIRLFLDDVEDGTYDGKFKMFDRMQTARNPALRKRLQLPDEVGGVMVRKPFRSTEDYPLKQWDVITKIGDMELDQQGNVQVKDDLRLSFRYMIPRFQEHGHVPLTIIREGQQQQISFPLGIEPEWLVPPLNGKYPRHFIFGPIVFSTGTQNLVQALGTRGQAMLAARRNPLISRRYDLLAFENEELVVMGARMFPHPIHEGYDPQTFGVVDYVNEQKINNLAQLVAVIRDSEGEFITFKLAGDYEIMIFPRQEMFDITEEILENEGIRYQFSKDLQAAWEGTDEPKTSDE